jgi:3-dehydroquinate synthase
MLSNLKDLSNFLKQKPYSKIFILVDEHTEMYCLPLLVEEVDETLGSCLLEVLCGEKSKCFTVVEDLCKTLVEEKADRDSIIISLGGGVISDIGGFVASIFKRGIQNINVPTTLLAMVDASIGGKTGINLNNSKNQIGTFNFSSLTFYDYRFLSSLSKRQMLNGAAEMIKIALIKDENLWNCMKKESPYDSKQGFDLSFIEKCISLKQDIVKQDMYDKDIRKVLNFGHTIGHAIEAIAMEKNLDIFHGEAVISGIFYAIKLSENKLSFPHNKALEIYTYLKENYKIFNIKDYTPTLYSYISQDKKNKDLQPHFILLKDIAQPKIDCVVSLQDIEEIAIL